MTDTYEVSESNIDIDQAIKESPIYARRVSLALWVLGGRIIFQLGITLIFLEMISFDYSSNANEGFQSKAITMGIIVPIFMIFWVGLYKRNYPASIGLVVLDVLEILYRLLASKLSLASLIIHGIFIIVDFRAMDSIRIYRNMKKQFKIENEAIKDKS